ncbi:MAG: DUF4150 domain-containing protein [Tabrizicola sp.]|nr:DUF4150 domain-containing protein [Tabrizicola sp.]
MGCTVFAATMGFFSKDSGGKSIAPVDVCFTPPPPPTGPITVPYVNLTFATDLKDGSRTVKADGQPTAIEDKSSTSKSSGDEAGSQPPKGVASANNTGPGKFATWSFTVKIEGLGVDCMGDQVIQNTNGSVMNCIDPAALVQFAAALFKLDMLKPCTESYDQSCRPPRNAAQRDEVNGKECWECAKTTPPGTISPWGADGKNKLQRTRGPTGDMAPQEYRTHDHQPPLCIAWEMGGCHMGKENFKALFARPEMVIPHCQSHYVSQGHELIPQITRIRPV